MYVSWRYDMMTMEVTGELTCLADVHGVVNNLRTRNNQMCDEV